MITVKRWITTAGMMAAFAVAMPAADVDGYLIDSMCSMEALKEGQKAAAMHTRECALMPDCVKSGYGVFTADGRFLKFDAAGNQKAEKALTASKQKDNIKVKVSGAVDGDTIQVASLKLR